MRNLAAIVAVLILIVPSVANAETFNGMGMGLRTCGQFAQDYRSNPQQAEADYTGWMGGYLTGRNMQRQAFGYPTADLGGMTLEQKMGFMREWCQENPLAQYSLGVQYLFELLPTVAVRPAQAKP